MEKINSRLLKDILETKDILPSLNFNYGKNSVLQGAAELAKILLYSDEPQTLFMYESDHESDFDRWYDAQSPGRQHKLSVWIYNGVLTFDWYFFEHFGERPEIREIFELLLSQKTAPPYLNVLLLYMIKQLFGLSNDAMAKITEDRNELHHWYEELLRHKTRAADWIIANGQALRFLGGRTNTILGYYDFYFDTLYSKRDFAAYFDLGGGFNTSEITRLTGSEFISLDLLSPAPTTYNRDIIMRRKLANGTIRCLNDAEMAAYFKRQSKVPWMAFDVGTDSIPSGFDSYFLTSTGFMTSTVKPSSGLKERWCAEPLEPQYRHILTSFIAMYRVIELVATGKNVCLMSVSRASSRYYANRAVWLEWKNGAIVDYKTVPKVKIHQIVMRNVKLNKGEFMPFSKEVP